MENNLDLRCKQGVSFKVALVLLFTLFATVAFSENSEVKLLKPIEALTSQETRPFLEYGKEMAPDAPKWELYSLPLKRFPDTVSCLQETEQSKDIVDLLLIDWKAPENQNGVEICIFRILTSMDSVEEMHTWLSYHEFDLTPFRRMRSDEPKTTQPKKYYSTHAINGRWTVEKYDERRTDVGPLWAILLIKAFPSFLGAKFYTLTISLTNEGQISGVGIDGKSKLNLGSLMAALQLAANLIGTTGIAGLNWGHLQIVHGSQELEVQAPVELSDVLDGNIARFSFPNINRSHSEHTDFAPGNGFDADNYKIINLSVGDRDPDEVWRLLSKVHCNRSIATAVTSP